jgi:hypothetical protein
VLPHLRRLDTRRVDGTEPPALKHLAFRFLDSGVPLPPQLTTLQSLRADPSRIVLTHRQFGQLTQLSLVVDIDDEGLGGVFERCDLSRLQALAVQFDGYNIQSSPPALPPTPAIRRLALFYHMCRLPALDFGYLQGHIDLFSLRALNCEFGTSPPILPLAHRWRLRVFTAFAMTSIGNLRGWAYQVAEGWGRRGHGGWRIDSLCISGYPSDVEAVGSLIKASKPREVILEREVLKPGVVGLLNAHATTSGDGRLRRVLTIDGSCCVGMGLRVQEMQGVRDAPEWDEGVLL